MANVSNLKTTSNIHFCITNNKLQIDHSDYSLNALYILKEKHTLIINGEMDPSMCVFVYCFQNEQFFSLVCVQIKNDNQFITEFHLMSATAAVYILFGIYVWRMFSSSKSQCVALYSIAVVNVAGEITCVLSNGTRVITNN